MDSISEFFGDVTRAFAECLKSCKVLTGSLFCYCSRHFAVAETPVADAGFGNANLQFCASKRLWDASAGKAVFLVSVITHSASVCRNKHSRQEKKCIFLIVHFEVLLSAYSCPILQILFLRALRAFPDL